MIRPLCGRLSAACLVLALISAFAALPAYAGDKRTGRIDLEASLEPGDLAPGGSGVLRVKGTLLGDGHHIYAKGDQAMKIEPIATPGVTFDMDALEITKSHEYKDDYGDVYQVWEHTFDLKVPVQIAADAAADAEVGLSFSYWGCLTDSCYPQVKNHHASVVLGASAGAAGVALPAKGAGGAPPAKGTGGHPKVAAAPDEAPKQVGGVPPGRGGQVSMRYDAGKKQLVVTFAPDPGLHMYGPGSTEGQPIAVEPVAAKGVTWGTPVLPPMERIEFPYEVTVPVTFEDSVTELEVHVSFSACDEMTCKTPVEGESIKLAWGDPGSPGPIDEPKGEGASGKVDVAFDYVTIDGADFEEEEAEAGFSVWRLLLVFAGGIGLAFTPCVLPIIPITVSVISGGNADIPKRRLTVLLLTYVLSLALTFAAMGVIAALAGGSISGAFTNPWVIGGIVVLFLVLAASMLGIFELQPPAWMMNLQGGAQKRSGSIIGAFLFGCLGAVIASPCTGPAIAGLLVETAKTGNVLFGFSMFFSMGLGMGAVFFAAGALNFAMKPGPWMVWVRYVFGMILFGAALWYGKDLPFLSHDALLLVGVVGAALAALGVWYHLTRKEGEAPRPAIVRGAKVAGLFLVAMGIVWWLAMPPDRELDWIYVRDRQHLIALVGQAREEGKPAVVDFWATWCPHCNDFDKLIGGDDELYHMFEHLKLIKVDLSKDSERWDLRHAVGLDAPQQPYMVFFDKAGRIVKGADVKGWYGLDDGPKELKRRLKLILPKEVMEEAKAR